MKYPRNRHAIVLAALVVLIPARSGAHDPAGAGSSAVPRPSQHEHLTAATQAVEPSCEQGALRRMLAAIEDGSISEFLALGDEAFRSMPPENFTSATKQFAPLLETSYQSQYLGAFRQKSYTVHYWKLAFEGANEDWLVKMATADLKVKEFFITYP